MVSPSATKNYGLIRHSAGKAILREIPIPTVRNDYILVRTEAVALNPTDWTTLDRTGDNGTLVGCDYSGVVEQVGKNMTKLWKVGDRVAGMAHGGNDLYPQNGAFARYISVKGDIPLRIPDAVSFEAASAVGVGVISAGFGLYKILGLPYPNVASGEKKRHEDEDQVRDGKVILIYGGSTATGTLAIQFANLSGYKVITTCSPKNFDLVKQIGADDVYDYRTPGIGHQIRLDTSNQLNLVFDTVSTESTAQICADAIGSSGGQYVNLLGPDCPRSDVKSTFFLGYDVSGEEYIFEGERFPARPDALAYAKEFMRIAEKLWAQGKWRPHPLRLEKGGLNGVIDGLRILREGRYSAEKLVYRVNETEWPSV